MADVEGTFVAQLIVNDGHNDSKPSTVTISTNAIQPPVANAGPAHAVEGIFAVGIRMIEEISARHVAAVAHGQGRQALVPRQRRAAECAAMTIDAGDEVPHLGGCNVGAARRGAASRRVCGSGRFARSVCGDGAAEDRRRAAASE